MEGWKEYFGPFAGRTYRLYTLSPSLWEEIFFVLVDSAFPTPVRLVDPFFQCLIFMSFIVLRRSRFHNYVTSLVSEYSVLFIVVH